jgi:hypothetical protein
VLDFDIPIGSAVMFFCIQSAVSGGAKIDREGIGVYPDPALYRMNSHR